MRLRISRSMCDWRYGESDVKEGEGMVDAADPAADDEAAEEDPEAALECVAAWTTEGGNEGDGRDDGAGEEALALVESMRLTASPKSSARVRAARWALRME